MVREKGITIKEINILALFNRYLFNYQKNYNNVLKKLSELKCWRNYEHGFFTYFSRIIFQVYKTDG